MRLRRDKAETPSRRVSPLGARTNTQTFSYYNNKQPASEITARRGTGRTATPSTPRLSRVMSLPVTSLLLLLVIVVCAASPKIIIVGSTPTSNAYQQTSAVYTQAAHNALASSITNRLKPSANTGGVGRVLEHEFPEMQTVSVALPLVGNRPIVYLAIAQPSLILQTTHGNYAVNQSGLVLARLSSLPADVPLVVDPSGTSPTIGKRFLPGSTVNFLHTVTYQMAAAKLPVTNYILPATSPFELDLRLEGKSYLTKFNLQGDPLEQSGAAIATLRHLGAITPASYLDVRVPGRIYYH
jgi:hypothetical protein